MRPRRRWLQAACLSSLAAGALVLTGTAAFLAVAHWSVRYAGGSGWTNSESAYFAAAWAGVLGAQLSGLWLWWRAPRNLTGLWLWLAGLSLGGFFLGDYWPNRWGVLVRLTIYAFRPALALALLGWPTGRPTPTIRRWIGWWTVTALVSGLVVGLFDKSSNVANWPANVLAPFDVAWVNSTVGAGLTWLLYFVAEAVVIVVLVRRRKGLPKGARRLLTPITIAGVWTAASDLLSVVVNSFGSGLVSGPTRLTPLGVANLIQDYGQLAIATAGILLAFAYRRRAVRSSERQLVFDLGTATPIVASSVALRRMLDDDTACVLYRRSSDVWVDAQGAIAVPGRPHRTATPVVDADGDATAVIETDEQRNVHPGLVEIAAATVSAGLTNERARAIAHARETELRALQIAVLDAIDSARRALERDLHDGAQQGLVGLALAARLAASQPDAEVRDALRLQVADTRAQLLELLDGAVPVVLTNGLAGALVTLAATTTLQAEVHARGDLEAGDPLARTMWLIANEATANAEKHAAASSLIIELAVDPMSTTLRVADDGRGGLQSPPRSIAARALDAGATVALSSPRGGGTEIVVVCSRTTAEAA